MIARDKERKGSASKKEKGRGTPHVNLFIIKLLSVHLLAFLLIVFQKVLFAIHFEKSLFCIKGLL
jgi:hypothetical protein